MPLNGGPSHTRLGKIHFQRIAALSARDLGNRTKSRSFQCRANRRSLRKAQWKLIHTEISYRVLQKKIGGERKKVLSQSTNSRARQKEQSVERRERRERDRRGRAHIVHRTHCPPPPLERVTIASLLSSLLCHRSQSLSPSHHYSLQLRVGAVGEGDHQCGS